MTTPVTKDVTVDHEEFQALLDRAEQFQAEGGNYATDGLDGFVDPDVLDALRSDEDKDGEAAVESQDDIDSARATDRDLQAASEESAAEIDRIDGDVSGAPSAGETTPNEATAQPTYTPSPVTPAVPGVGIPSQILGGAASTAPYNPQLALAQMQQPGMVDYSNYTPTPQTATQYDLNNAPNREELVQLIQEYADAEYSDSEYADNDEYTGGGGTVAPADGSAGASEKEVKRIAQELVDMRQDYTWGGGHGAEPGPSQGTTDGGTADSFGDYNKVGMDCSGLSRYFVYQLTGGDEFGGVDIGAGGTYDQINAGVGVSEADIKPGDLVFPHEGHVQVYIGDGQVVEAQQSGTKYMISEFQPGNLAIRRVVE